MNRKIQIQLQRSQMEVLSISLASLYDEDLWVHGQEIGIILRFFITRISDRINSRLENRETNKRKFKVSFHPAEVAALQKAFDMVRFKTSTEAAMLRTVLMELDRNI